jgi:hypothetical protein
MADDARGTRRSIRDIIGNKRAPAVDVTHHRDTADTSHRVQEVPNGIH